MVQPFFSYSVLARRSWLPQVSADDAPNAHGSSAILCGRKTDSNLWSHFENGRPLKTRHRDCKSFGRRERHHFGGVTKG